MLSAVWASRGRLTLLAWMEGLMYTQDASSDQA